MTTDTSGSQQSNPGTAVATATDAANPEGATSTATTPADGQGTGGDNAGVDAGKQGDQPEGGEGTTGDGQAKTDDTPPELTGAPEAFADFVLPEGFALEGERKELAQTLFRDLNLSQAGAQRAVDEFIKLVGEDAAMQQQAMEAAVAQQREEWGKQAKTELGDQYDAEVAYAKTAVQAMQNPKLVEAFDAMGWGNHPELVKAFAFFGKMMRDSPIEGIGSAGSASAPKTPWDTLYPDMK